MDVEFHCIVYQCNTCIYIEISFKFIVGDAHVALLVGHGAELSAVPGVQIPANLNNTFQFVSLLIGSEMA